MTERGFRSKYGGNHPAPMRLIDAAGYEFTFGDLVLITDDGEIINTNFCRSPQPAFVDIMVKYGDYGIRKVVKRYLTQEIYIGRLNERELKMN